MADVSGVGTIPGSSAVLYPEHNAECMLNTEDFEIPFNDHIPSQSSLEPTSTMDQDSQDDACLVLAQPSSPSPPIKLESAILEQNTMVSLNEGSIIGHEPLVLHDDFGGRNADVYFSSAFR